MEIKQIIFLLFLFPLLLFAENNESWFDDYHDQLCKVLISTSHSIDDYFIEGNRSVISSTRAELISSMAMENGQPLEKNIRVRLRLNLPKIQKHLRLILEDEESDNILYNGTTLTDERLQDKRYYLRLEYFKWMKEQFNIVFAGGVRIRKGNLVPYANVRSEYDFYDKSDFKSSLSNRFRYYTDGEVENTAEFNSIYSLTDSIYSALTNQLRYDNRDGFETMVNDISIGENVSEKKQVNVGMGVVSFLQNFKNPSVDYYHVHAFYHHVFYKNWVYYDLAPSVLWRRINDFQISYRVMMNFGIKFN